MTSPKIVLLASLIAGLCACAGAPTKKAPSPTEQAMLLIDAANGAINENDPIGALQLLASAEKLDDSIPEIYHTRAIAFYDKHDLPSALRDARKAVAMRKDYSDAENTLGKLLIDTGDFAEAEKPLLQAAADPVYREAYKAHTNLGILYYRQERYGQAQSQFDAAVDESPALACVAYYYRGHLHLRKGEYRKAVSEYDKATRRYCTNFADAHLALGIAYERNKQYDLARKKYLDVRNTFPDSKVAEQATDRLRYLP